MGTKVEKTENHMTIPQSKLDKKRAEGKKWLDDNFGKHSSGITLTKEELDKLAKDITPEESKEIARALGFR